METSPLAKPKLIEKPLAFPWIMDVASAASHLRQAQDAVGALDSF